jgi:hypothetical protein
MTVMEDAGSDRATAAMSATSQVSGGASDNTDAFAPPGTAPVGPLLPEASASLHNDPHIEPIDLGDGGRHLVHEGGEAS